MEQSRKGKYGLLVKIFLKPTDHRRYKQQAVTPEYKKKHQRK